MQEDVRWMGLAGIVALLVWARVLGARRRAGQTVGRRRAERRVSLRKVRGAALFTLTVVAVSAMGLSIQTERIGRLAVRVTDPVARDALLTWLLVFPGFLLAVMVLTPLGRRGGRYYAGVVAAGFVCPSIVGLVLRGLTARLASAGRPGLTASGFGAELGPGMVAPAAVWIAMTLTASFVCYHTIQLAERIGVAGES